MTQHLHFCGIFAIATIVLTTITITSCDRDNDFYLESENDTLAERMLTRAGEEPWSPYIAAGSKDTTIYLKGYCPITIKAEWNAGYVRNSNISWSAPEQGGTFYSTQGNYKYDFQIIGIHFYQKEIHDLSVQATVEIQYYLTTHSGSGYMHYAGEQRVYDARHIFFHNVLKYTTPPKE